MVRQRLNLLALPVVSDADNWRFCIFNHLYQGCNTASIACANSVDFIHYYYALLGVLATKGLL